MMGLLFLSRISTGSHTVEWVSVLVITGMGIGVALQYPFVAMESVLSGADRLTGYSI
jgi:hypothetical protein